MRRAALVLVLATFGCGAHPPRLDQPRYPVVQLVRARLPMPLKVIAVHYWFNAYDPKSKTWERWELWQVAGQSATSWGHVHRDLMDPSSGVGGGEPVLEAEWTGDDAARLVATLHRPEDYPDRATYRAWPGPNSNTYVAWVLRESGVSADLDPLAIGKDWRGWVGGGTTTTGTGLHFETPLVGIKLGAIEGIELHFLTLTFGFAFFHPALKTPFGSLAMPEL